MAKKQTKEERVTVRLDAEDGEVNAAAVGATMTAIVALVEQAHKEIAANERLLVKARPFSKGSFEIPLELIVFVAGGLLTTSPLLEQLLEMLKRYFDITVALRGSKAAVTNSTTITVNGDLIGVSPAMLSLLSPTSSTETEMVKAAQAIRDDPSIRALEIRRGKEKTPFVKVTREQLEFFAQPVEQAKITRERNVASRETLSIRAVDFEGNRKWGFNRQGAIITARISDERFLARVQGGAEVFQAGDRLDVELVIHQKFNETTRDYENKSFVISRVWDHVRRNVQPELFAEE